MAPITNKYELDCNECKDKIDCYGQNALSCPDAICDKIYEFCVMAKLGINVY